MGSLTAPMRLALKLTCSIGEICPDWSTEACLFNPTGLGGAVRGASRGGLDGREPCFYPEVALHGAALAAHKLWSTRFGPFVSSLTSWPRFLWQSASRTLTLATVLIGWIFFRSEGLPSARQFLGRILSWQTTGTNMPSAQIVGAIGLVALVHCFLPKDGDWAEELVDRSMLVRIVVYASLLTLLVCLGATDAVPFIYFQF